MNFLEQFEPARVGRSLLSMVLPSATQTRNCVTFVGLFGARAENLGCYGDRVKASLRNRQMELPGIEALQGALAASTPAASAAKVAGGAGAFLDVLKRSLDQVNQTQTQADSLAKQFQLGQNGVTLEDAMVSMQKANISFQSAVQVRNKLVAAYHDVMNMQI